MRHTVEEIKLKNGGRGLLIDVPDATVMSFQFYFRAGSRLTKKPEIYETAHIMEHMAFGANSQFKDEHAFEAEFTKNGAYHNASTSDYGMEYVASCADFEWNRILDLQRVSIATPKFNSDELEAEKGNVRSELTGYLNVYNRVLWPKLQQVSGESVMTYQQRLRTIAHISLADIREHYRRTHTSKNFRFVIAGMLHGRKASIKRQLEEWELHEGTRIELPDDEYIHPHKPTLIRRKEAPNLTFGWTNILNRKINDKESDALSALDHILTGTMYSKIYGAARKKGLAYGVWSDYNVGHMSTSWDFGGEVNIDKSEELFDIIVREIKAALKGEITVKELETVKQYFLGRFQMGAQTVGQIAGFYSGRYFSDGFIKDYERVPEFIQNISVERIVQIAREFIAAHTWVLGGVSAMEREQLDALHEKLSSIFT
jgi:predicted Zn-dependent peptidase